MAGRCGQMSRRSTQIPEKFAPDFLDALDGRCRVARDLRLRWQALVASQGGASELSYTRRSLIDRFIHVESWLESQEQALANGEKVDMARYFSGLNSFTGLLNKLGLERRRKPVQSLNDYLTATPTQDLTEVTQ